MPTYRDITINVTDSNNRPLTEWGVRRHGRSSLTTCYIQSKTDMAFQIRIIPKLPFPDHETKPDTNESPSDDEIDEFGRTRELRKVQPSTTTSTLVRNSIESQELKTAPWHLLATLRLDGRQGFEKRSIIYLDASHPDFDRFRGQVTMKSRTVKDEEGRLRDCGWLFKEIGIDSVFQKLRLLGEDEGDDAVPRKEDDGLSTAFNTLATNLEDAEEKPGAGQIEITIERVTLGETTYDFWQGRRGESIDVNMSASDMSTISHTVARDKGKRKDDMVKFISYELLDPVKSPYAIFRFYYRNEETLRKFNFPGFAPKATPASAQRQRKQALTMAAAAPLSILNRKPIRYFYNGKGDIIGEEDIPVIDLTKTEQAPVDGSDSKLWMPKDDKRSINTIKDDTVDSPPDSPTRDEDTETTPALEMGHKKWIKIPSSTLNEAEQSSADEFSPPKQNTTKPTYMLKFRNIDDATTEGEEADDEASDGGQTPNSMGFRDDLGDAVGDDGDGISRNEPDGGIGEQLNKVVIGSKRIGGDEDEGDAEGIASTSKKTRVKELSTEDKEKEGNFEEEL